MTRLMTLNVRVSVEPAHEGMSLLSFTLSVHANRVALLQRRALS